MVYFLAKKSHSLHRKARPVLVAAEWDPCSLCESSGLFAEV